MATSPSKPAQRKIVNVVFLHIDDARFGPQGNLTRSCWRNKCFFYLMQGQSQFSDWQSSWKDNITRDLPRVSLATKLIYDDGTSEDILVSSTFAPTTLDFVGQTFDADLYAAGITFITAACFDSAAFNGDANFNKASFSGDAYFNSAVFSGEANFNNSIFSAGAVAYFSNAAFVCDANFNRAMFLGNANFKSVVFGGDAYFCSATFERNVDFFKVHFKNQCRFDNKQDIYTKAFTKETSFGGDVNFENATFDNLGHFERVKFNNETPKFRGCKIGDTRLEFSDDSYFPKNENSEDAIKDISFLKRLADEHGQTDQALNFNAMELHAKRAQARGNTQYLKFNQKLFNSNYWFANATALYEQFSDYGRSYTKPLKWYLILLFFTLWLALVNSIIYSAKNCKNEIWYLFTNLNREQIECLSTKSKENEKPFKLTAWRAASEYTLYRAAGVLDFADSDKQTKEVARRLFDQEIEPWWMRIWGVFKAIASTALLFLAALGLRNKYRIK